MSDLIRSIKKAAVDAIEAASPVQMAFGKVQSVDPFEIAIDQKLILPEEFIVIGQYVREYSLDLTIPGEMWRGFRTGDELILARMQGGQQYIIMDFITRVDADTRPARVMTGEVVSTAPEIKVNDYLTLKSDQLILCRNVTEYQLDMSVSHESETERPPHDHDYIDSTGSAASPVTKKTQTGPHTHVSEGRKKFTVHNGLEVGDKVMLVCERVSQKWYVVDYISRVASAINGEWL